MSPKHLICSSGWTNERILRVLGRASTLKAHKRNGQLVPTLERKTAFLLFYLSSTRTRAACEAAMTLLGGHAQFVDATSTRLSHGESIRDIANVYSRLGDLLGVRADTKSEGHRYGQGWNVISQFAENATIPVVNLACDRFHPCQGLADLMTARGRVATSEGNTFVVLWGYSSHMRDPCSSQEDMLIMSRFGFNVTVCHPPGFDFEEALVDQARQSCVANGSTFRVTHDRRQALEGAQFVFPRNWMASDRARLSPSCITRTDERVVHERFRHWTLTDELVRAMADERFIAHVMPVARGEEASDAVLDSHQCIMYEQAENKLYVQMAVFEDLLSAE